MWCEILGNDAHSESTLALVLDREDKTLNVISIDIAWCAGQDQVGLET